jgi:hypothetical protein
MKKIHCVNGKGRGGGSRALCCLLWPPPSWPPSAFGVACTNLPQPPPSLARVSIGNNRAIVLGHCAHAWALAMNCNNSWINCTWHLPSDLVTAYAACLPLSDRPPMSLVSTWSCRHRQALHRHPEACRREGRGRQGRTQVATCGSALAKENSSCRWWIHRSVAHLRRIHFLEAHNHGLNQGRGQGGSRRGEVVERERKSWGWRRKIYYLSLWLRRSFWWLPRSFHQCWTVDPTSKNLFSQEGS